jgi:hypothetical protein
MVSTDSYLQMDLSVRCTAGEYRGEEHDMITTIATGLMFAWPVGMVALYAAVLLPCHQHIQDHVHTPLVRAVRFLTIDYKVT